MKKTPKKTVKKLPKGRPTKYNLELTDIICARIAAGESLVSICRTDDMPSCVTVYAWLRKHEDFLNRYACAREDQADTLSDQIIDIADTCVIGEKTKILPDGSEEITRGDMIERARLKVDARKWVAAKLKPKKYGDKLQTEHSGEITTKYSGLTDAELEAEINKHK
jgi:hypothetical protein